MLYWRRLGAVLVLSWCYPDVVYRGVVVALSMEQRERSVFLCESFSGGVHGEAAGNAVKAVFSLFLIEHVKG